MAKTFTQGQHDILAEAGFKIVISKLDPIHAATPFKFEEAK